MVRCFLDGESGDPLELVRFIPLTVFELWRFLMEQRHGRRVRVDEISVWMPEAAAVWADTALEPDLLQPVLRVHIDRPGPLGVTLPVERFFPAETYPAAQEALLGHYDAVCRQRVTATPGYFVPAEAWRRPIVQGSLSAH